MKEDWVEYKRTSNKLRKQERQIEWMNQKYEDYLESAEHAMVNSEDCDMHCAHQCIKERSELDTIIDCMHSECHCDFYFDVSEMTESSDGESEKSGDEESLVSVRVEDICNSTCTESCADPKSDEIKFSKCM